MTKLLHPLSWTAVLVPSFVLLGFALIPKGAAESVPAWRADLGAALREARAAGKDVLIEFTTRDGGTDDAVPAVDRLVYNTERYLRAAGKRFVLVRLTVTTGAAGGGDAGVIALAEHHAIRRVPSLVLLDVDSRPYASVESDDSSVDAQVALLEAASEARPRRDEALARASAATGAERAKYLHDALRQVGRFAMSDYESTVTEVVALDPSNSLGLKEKYIAPLTERRVDRAIQSRVYPLADRGEFAAAMNAIDEIIAAEKPPAAHAQLLVAFKAELLLSLGRPDESRRLFEEALALSADPGSTEKIRRAMQRLDP